ncbi:unnamed protein product [Parascedosporium putredinis]|uniref:Pre-mRNA-splicing factor PRP46 n=1 Tax=Parascedosporium putredinis TaxID=1442378 RepID=A0A9P1GZS4_9PEZI|nr:unnamed protein product [Parascedosporium putredinis]CAI7993158.1 unnamed protein product [Parascedosporium putredinis]
MGVLTHHKKGVRALALHPTEFTFASASTGSIKQWKCPEGAFMQNFEGQNTIINTLCVNADNVLFSGGKQVVNAGRICNVTHNSRYRDNGSMSFWDWKSGHQFQSLGTTAQPGSLDAEGGIMSATTIRLGDFYSPPTNIEGPPGIATNSGYFSAGKLYSIRVNNSSWNTFKTRLDDLYKLLVSVPRKRDSR